VIHLRKNSIKSAQASEPGAQGDLGSANIKLSQYYDADKPDDAVSIALEEPLTMTYSLRYFTLFTKAACLSNRVTISLGNDVPAAVEFKIDDSAGYVRFYLAPKIEDDS